MIPRRIVHVYGAPPGAPDELPLAAQTAVANARLLHPDFEHVLFDRQAISDLLRDSFPEYLDVFMAFEQPIQRFDFFRYLAIYRFGGFYLDLDVYLAHSLEPLLQHDCVFPFEELTIYDHMRHGHGVDWDVANYAFGAAPGHPFIRAVIENCVRGVRDPRWRNEMLRSIPRWARQPYVAPASTGPGLVSRTLAERPDLAPGVTVLFPRDVCCQNGWHTFGEFGVHLMQGSWRRRSGFVRDRLTRWWERRAIARAVSFGQALGPERMGPWKRVLPTTACPVVA